MIIEPPSPSTSRSSSPAGSDVEEQRASKKRRVEFEEAQTVAGKAVEAASLQFVPPRGLEKATPDEALTEFSYEAIQQRLSEGCELWAVRLPSGLKPRHLSEAKLRRPSKKTKTTEKLGDLKAKKVNYDVYTLGTDDGSEQANDIGAGEMKSLIPLLANKQRRYSSANLPISRHIVVRQSLNFPGPLQRGDGETKDGDEASDSTIFFTSTHEQPEGLNGFFAPPGSETAPDLGTPHVFPKKQKPQAANCQEGADEPVGDITMDTTMSGSPSKKEKKDKKDKKDRKDKKEKKRKRKSEVAAEEAD